MKSIKRQTSKELKRQVQVLYYNSKDDFAIKLLTKQNEELIIQKVKVHFLYKNMKNCT